MPPCHVQVKTPNFFSASTPQNKKDLVGFCDTSGNCNTDWILFLSVLEGLGSMRVKLLILSVFLAKLGDFGWESESLSGEADLVEQDLIPGQSAASVLQCVTVCYSVLQSVTARVLPVLHRFLSTGLLLPRKWKIQNLGALLSPNWNEPPF